MNIKEALSLIEEKKASYLNGLKEELLGQKNSSNVEYITDNGFWFFHYTPFQDFLCEYEESLVDEAKKNGFDVILDDDRVMVIHNDKNIEKLNKVIKEEQNIICSFETGFFNNVPFILSFKVRVRLE